MYFEMLSFEKIIFLMIFLIHLEMLVIYFVDDVNICFDIFIVNRK